MPVSEFFLSLPKSPPDEPPADREQPPTEQTKMTAKPTTALRLASRPMAPSSMNIETILHGGSDREAMRATPLAMSRRENPIAVALNAKMGKSPIERGSRTGAMILALIVQLAKAEFNGFREPINRALWSFALAETPSMGHNQ